MNNRQKIVDTLFDCTVMFCYNKFLLKKTFVISIECNKIQRQK